MSVTSAQLSAVSTRLSTMQTRLHSASQRYIGFRSGLWDDMRRLGGAGSSPDLQQVTADGRRLHSQTSDVPGELQSAADALGTVSDTASGFADELQRLEGQRDTLREELRAVSSSAGVDDDKQRELRRVESRIDEIDGEWQEEGSAGAVGVQALSDAESALRSARQDINVSDLARRVPRTVGGITILTGYGIYGFASRLGRGALHRSDLRHYRRRRENAIRRVNDGRSPRGGRLDRLSQERLNRANQNWRHDRPLTNTGQQIRNNPVLRNGGRALGVFGTAMSATDSITSFRDGDIERGVTQGAQAVGGAMMMVPVPGVQIAGAAIVAGAMIWENREWIADKASDLGNAVTDAAKGAKDWVSDKLPWT